MGRRSRLVSVVVLAALLVALLATPARALSIGKAELRGTELRIEGSDAAPNADIVVDGVTVGSADGGGDFDIRFSPFSSATCVAQVSDGSTIESVDLDRCTPSGPPANQAPTANAGPDQTLIDTDGGGAETVTLDGTASSDADGSISSYSWTEGATAVATGPNPTAGLTLGAHTITLTVTDNDGATATDTVVITINPPAAGNVPPIADAGVDRTFVDDDGNNTQTIVLDARGSSDPDGTIVLYEWTDANGNFVSNNTTPITGLPPGVYTFTLTVTDNDGATDTDIVVMTVEPRPGTNTIPTANAGPDQNVIDADNSGAELVTLDGSASTDDGTIVSYEWVEGGVVLGGGSPGTLVSARSTFADSGQAIGTSQPVSADWIDQAEAGLALAEYEVGASVQGLQAPNRANDLRTLFSPSGVTIQDRQAGTELVSLALDGVGRANALDPVPPGVVSSDGPRVEIARPGVTEWYQNTAAGLEQGFTIDEPPGGLGDLVVELGVDGARAHIDAQTIELATDAGRTLTYDKLVTIDANGTTLPSSLEVRGSRTIRIVVDDSNATYPVVIDPVVSGTFDQMFESNQPDPPGFISNAFGGSVGSAGDINNDGFDDILISAPIWDGGEFGEGAVFVFLGGATGVIGSDPATAHTRIESDEFGAQLSASNPAGDVNGDGFDDIIVGAINYTSLLPGTQLEVNGAAFVFHGGATGISDTPVRSVTTADGAIFAHQQSSDLGATVDGAGDVNGDGFADVVVSVPDEGRLFPPGIPINDRSGHFGAILVFHGSAAGITGTGFPDADTIILPYVDTGEPLPAVDNQVGNATSAGDVNNDGFGDLIVGGTELTLYLGSSAGITAQNIFDADDRVFADPPLQVSQSIGGAGGGFLAEAAGDVNNDGFPDIVGSIPGFTIDSTTVDTAEGAVYVIHGGATGLGITSVTQANTSIVGTIGGEIIGATIAGAGDVDNDTFDDLLVGGLHYAGSLFGEGVGYLFRGGSQGISATTVADADTRIEAIQEGAVVFANRSAMDLDAAGDVNGDGFADIITGKGFWTNGDENEGAAFLYFGEPFPANPNIPPVADAGPEQEVYDVDADGTITATVDASGSFDPDGTIVSYEWYLATSTIATGATLIGTGPQITVGLPLSSAIGFDGHYLTVVVTDDQGIRRGDRTKVYGRLAPSEQVFFDEFGPDFGAWTPTGAIGLTDGGPSVSPAPHAHMTGNATLERTFTVPAGTTGLDLEFWGRGLNFGPSDKLTVRASFDGGPMIDYFDITNPAESDGFTFYGGSAIPISLSWWPNTASTVTMQFAGQLSQGEIWFDRPRVEAIMAPTGGASNTPPTAEAGPDQAVTDTDMNGSEVVTLDGSRSFDADGTIASYVWLDNGQTIGTTAVIDPALDVGTHSLTLLVTDNLGATDADTLVVVVNAGSVPGDPTLSVPLAVGAHTITLTVTDDQGATATDQVVVTVEAGGPGNAAPVAVAGADQVVVDGDGTGAEVVTLDGSGSSDPEGQPLIFGWAEGATSLGNTAVISPSLAVGTHTIELTVTDDQGATAVDQVVVTVNAPAANQSPTAVAGTDQSVVDEDGTGAEVVTLDGSGSSDPEGQPLIFGWAGGATSLGNTAVISPSLAVGTHTIELTVTDDQGATAVDQVVVTVDAAPPTGGGETVFVSSTSGGSVGGVSFADEDILAFDATTGAWSMFLDGSDVGLSGAGARDIDAFAVQADGSVLLSIVAASTLPDIGAIDDSDIVRFVPSATGTATVGTFEMYVDGSDVGLSTNGEDIDAISVLANGDVVISTTGSASVPGVSTADEDLLRFTPTSLGVTTAGTWAVHFDGSDVGLNTSSSEDIHGVWVDGNGDLYLTTRGTFAVAGVTGSGADIFTCTGHTPGSGTACASHTLFFNGAANEFGAEIADGIHITNN